jgi:hypothetical protein
MRFFDRRFWIRIEGWRIEREVWWGRLESRIWLLQSKLRRFLVSGGQIKNQTGIATISRPVAGVLGAESAVLGVYVRL